MNASVADNLSDAGGINAFGSNITLKGLTIDAGNVPAEEGKFTAAVSNHNGAVGGTGFSLHVENCTICLLYTSISANSWKRRETG